MTIQNRNTAIAAPAPTLPLISDTSEESLISSLSDMHSLVATYGEPLPAFADCGIVEYSRILGRVKAALEAKVAARREEEQRAFKGAIRSVIAPRVDDAKAEYDSYLEMVESASGAVKKFIAPFTPYIMVPVSEFASVFAPLTPVESQVKKLNEMGYTVAKNADKTHSVRIALPFMAKPATAAGARV